MIDPQNRFIFIHIPKNAGQSISTALRHHALTPRQRLLQTLMRRLWRKTKHDHYGLYRGGWHGTAREVREAVGAETFEGAYKFAFVRNPWDRMLSLFRFEQLEPKRSHYEVSKSTDLEGYLDYLASVGFPTQESYLVDDQGNLLVDYVGRFETLENDFALVCDKLGITERLPHKNSSGRGDFRARFTPKAVDLVAEMFAADIDRFGYRFE